MLRTCVLVVCVPLLCCDVQAETTARFQRDAINVEILRSRVLTAQQKIKSLSVEYEAAGSGPDAPDGGYVHRVTVVKNPYYLYQLSSHGDKALPWMEDPFQHAAYVTPTEWYSVFPLSHAYGRYSLKADDPLPGSLNREIYFLATGLWPLDRPPPRPNGLPYMLKDIAASNTPMSIAPVQELVNDRWCHVLVAGNNDKLWLDGERDLAMLRREISNDSGRLVQRFELADHREVAPGVWLPTIICSTVFDWKATTAAGRSRKVLDTQIRILKTSVNDVSDTTFQYLLTAGTLHFGRDDEPAQQAVPGGIAHLDRVAAWIMRYTPADKDAITADLLSGVFLCCGGVGLVLINFVALRHNGKRRTMACQ